MCARGGGQLWRRRPLARRRARRRAAPSARTLRLRECPCAHGSRGLHRRSGATHATLRRKPWVIGSRRCPCPLARRWARAQLNTPHGVGVHWGRCPWDGQRRRPKTAADTAGFRWWCQCALKWAPQVPRQNSVRSAPPREHHPQVFARRASVADHGHILGA